MLALLVDDAPHLLHGPRVVEEGGEELVKVDGVLLELDGLGDQLLQVVGLGQLPPL